MKIIIDEETTESELNAKLRNILARASVVWGDRSKYLLISQALKGDISLKKSVIKKYA